MKRLVAFLILLMFTLTPLVRACITPGDYYAVGVALNRPGITYNLSRLMEAHNVISEGNALIYRSHYDERLYVLVWNASDGLHVRVGIPINWTNSSVLRASFNASLILTGDVLEKLRSEGWDTVDNTTFTRDGVIVSLIPVKETECSSDSDCATGGCNGEVCAPKEEAGKIVTPCVYKSWYSCLSLSTCGCVNGTCTWKPNPDFKACLKEHGVDPSSVIRAGRTAVYVTAVEKTPEEAEASVEEFMHAFGVSCNMSIKFEKHTDKVPAPLVDPRTLKASKAIKTELEWLREWGVIEISKEDVEEIAGIARWGYAGQNSHIGWYETKNGTFSWIPYHESRNPRLVKCSSIGVPTYRLPNGTAYFDSSTVSPSSPTASTTTTVPSSSSSSPPEEGGGICGPAFSVVLILLVPLFRKR